MTEPEIAAEGVLVLRTHSDDSADAPLPAFGERANYRQTSLVAVPAKAGTYLSATRNFQQAATLHQRLFLSEFAEGWTPAFAGEAGKGISSEFFHTLESGDLLRRSAPAFAGEAGEPI
jgi:hypothetical protein